ncbi:MAG: 4'-phosphopantetheinyl transferase superfamily protein [Desulfobulbaceae bacterium]|nr:4'-phosphopantetheinyl transferase superfamily protein [Desulfobulbaceae bacterium]
MKNSKRFSTSEWQETPLLSPTELDSYRQLFLGNEAQFALSFINLTQLSTVLLESHLAATYLTNSEQERLATFTFAKRHREWLGGRLTAKKAAMKLLNNGPCPASSYQELSVESHESGRPFLLGSANTNALLPEISISHSGNYAGALAVSGHACGLDLQQVSPKVIAIRERFASPPELALLLAKGDSLGEAQALTLLWSAKESLRKAVNCAPLLGFTEITLLKLQKTAHAGLIGHFSCPRLDSTLRTVFFLLHEDYACAITVISASSPGS